jgi:hypothetical protein
MTKFQYQKLIRIAQNGKLKITIQLQKILQLNIYNISINAQPLRRNLPYS